MTTEGSKDRQTGPDTWSYWLLLMVCSWQVTQHQQGWQSYLDTSTRLVTDYSLFIPCFKQSIHDVGSTYLLHKSYFSTILFGQSRVRKLWPRTDRIVRRPIVHWANRKAKTFTGSYMTLTLIKQILCHPAISDLELHFSAIIHRYVGNNIPFISVKYTHIYIVSIFI